MNVHTSLPSERTAIAAVIAPGALTTGAKNSGWIDLAKYHQLACIISTGTLGTSATVDGKWQLADDSSGTNPVDATGVPALTQILKAAGDNKQAVHNLNVNSLTLRTKRFARYVMTIGVATSDAAAIIIGTPRHHPATDNDPASVVQVT